MSDDTPLFLYQSLITSKHVYSVINVRILKRIYGLVSDEFPVKMSGGECHRISLIIGNISVGKGLVSSGKKPQYWQMFTSLCRPQCVIGPGAPSSQYRSPHYKHKTVLQSSHLYNGNPFPGKIVSILWIGPLLAALSRFRQLRSANLWCCVCSGRCSLNT